MSTAYKIASKGLEVVMEDIGKKRAWHHISVQGFAENF